MAIGPPAGAVIDVYREHVTATPATYTAPVSDDFRQNAVDPAVPTNPSLGRCPAYGSQQLVRTWQEQLKQFLIQT